MQYKLDMGQARSVKEKGLTSERKCKGDFLAHTSKGC